MQLGTLDAKHDSYDDDRWDDITALCEGGQKFHNKITRYLVQNPQEPFDLYNQRKQQSHYQSYMGSIIGLYASWLFSSSFSAKAYERDTETPVASLPPFYGQFQENVGNEKKLSDFVKERFREALKTGKALWLVERPSNEGIEPESALEFEQRNLGNATLKAIEEKELFDFEEDDQGQLIWASVHTQFEARASWTQARDTVTEIWRIYDRELVHTYQLEYKKKDGRPKDPNHEVPQMGPPVPHGFSRVPVVRLCIPKELCVGEQTFDAQLEHFRLDNALSWLIRRTCYAQPIFNVEDAEAPPALGVGYAIIIGKEDKMGWTSPPTAPFDVLQKNVDNKRDEIYRVVHQMAQGVDNNAETVGRSADSKEIDAAATRILLNEYGSIVCGPVEETYEIISEARGEKDYEWSIEGFAGYDTATVSSLIANAKTARGLGISSKTWVQEVTTKVALALLPEADQRVKDTIRREITDANPEVLSFTLEEAQAEAEKAKAGLDDVNAKLEPERVKAAAKAPKPKPGTPG